MAAIGFKGKQRIAASSILEVVVSMVIIVMVLGISLMIYSNVVRQSLSARQLKAQFLLQQTLLKVDNGSLEQTEVVDQWQINREIKPYEADTRLILVHLTAYDEQHNLIAEIRKVMIGHEKE
jgi:Tfp pilus assembly protein PilV